jgi:hypothetical protein
MPQIGWASGIKQCNLPPTLFIPYTKKFEPYYYCCFPQRSPAVHLLLLACTDVQLIEGCADGRAVITAAIYRDIAQKIFSRYFLN